MNDRIPAQRLLACVGEPSRFRVVRSLLGGQQCVSDLARAVGLSQSCTTRHLQALRREGVVRGQRSGKRVLFRLCLDDPAVATLVQWASSGAPGAPPVPAEPVARRRRRPAAGHRLAAAPAGGDGGEVNPPQDPAEHQVKRRNASDLDDYLL